MLILLNVVCGSRPDWSGRLGGAVGLCRLLFSWCLVFKITVG